MSKAGISNYLELENVIKQISQITNAINILKWDMSTNVPIKSVESRKDEITNLSSIAHSMLKSSKVAELIKKTQEESSGLNSWQLANLMEIEKRYIEAECIDDSLFKRYVSATSFCQIVWQEAKKDNDYIRFQPYLQEVLDTVKEISQQKSSKLGISQYDALLDIYDPEGKSSELKSVFKKLKTKIPELIHRVIDKQKSELVIPITKNISIEKQKLISRKLMEIMGFDFDRGRIDESAHPFCGGTSHDIRLTTRYNDNLIIGIMNVIHETGHGLYEQSLPSIYRDQPVGKAKGMAIHESQSLLMEMQIGRSKEFTTFLAKLLKGDFGFTGPEYSAENLYKLVTRVKNDFIRTDADEITYPMHVILRFEIEEALINNNLSLNELPEHWNKKMQEYVGVTPSSDREGCMQDIHWSMGLFGYFPVYISGSIIASMIMKRAKYLNPSLGQEIEEGNLININKFMDSNLRSFGSLHPTQKLIKRSSDHEEISPAVFLSYLEDKYLGKSIDG